SYSYYPRLVRANPHLNPFPTRRSSDLCRRKGGTGRTVRRPQRRGRGRDAHAHERSCRKPCEPTRPSRRGVTMIFDAEDEGSSTEDRKSTRLNSSHVSISYAVFCLKKKK